MWSFGTQPSNVQSYQFGNQPSNVFNLPPRPNVQPSDSPKIRTKTTDFKRNKSKSGKTKTANIPNQQPFEFAKKIPNETPFYEFGTNVPNNVPNQQQVNVPTFVPKQPDTANIRTQTGQHRLRVLPSNVRIPNSQQAFSTGGIWGQQQLNSPGIRMPQPNAANSPIIRMPRFNAAQSNQQITTANKPIIRAPIEIINPTQSTTDNQSHGPTMKITNSGKDGRSQVYTINKGSSPGKGINLQFNFVDV